MWVLYCLYVCYIRSRYVALPLYVLYCMCVLIRVCMLGCIYLLHVGLSHCFYLLLHEYMLGGVYVMNWVYILYYMYIS